MERNISQFHCYARGIVDIEAIFANWTNVYIETTAVHS